MPRRCGIATFTTDLELAVRHLDDVAQTAIIAMCDPGGQYAFPPHVRWSIAQEDAGGYLAAADFIHEQGFDVVSLQHEFGIYGGEAGDYILGLIAALRIPLVTTLHTVLDRPSDAQRKVTMALLAASARVVVMAQKGRSILIDIYGADPQKILVIPHGIPDMPLIIPQQAKEKLGFSGHRIILTFGLISPNKGIETMIEAMPAVLAAAPDTVYVVMGATHPTLLREAGEAYRESLIALVHKLGLDGHVVFLNRFVDRPELLQHIAMCDVYVTPYLVETQMTSGTLAYSHGLGRPVVSTPYWHALELLTDGSGALVPFGDTAALGAVVADLLTDEASRLAMGRRAYVASRTMTWRNTALRYREAFRSVCRKPVPVLPAMPLDHFAAMCDSTGLLQHAVYDIPDRSHGYCIDDNARALLLCGRISSGDQVDVFKAMRPRFAGFIQHGWNPVEGRFRNFMSYDRRWLEDVGSEDSHGRTLWALGACMAQKQDPQLAQWASALFEQALIPVKAFTSPRAWAFALLGLSFYCSARPNNHEARRLQLALGGRLHARLLACESEDWVWFEDRLTYDNARLCEALILTGKSCGSRELVEDGLRSLRWLLKHQTAPEGHFRPVGSQGFLLVSREAPLCFDQQPVEACATIAACLAASFIDPAPVWHVEAHKAFAWFTGANDLGLPLVDITTGSCCDGLHPDRANENKGAESLLSYLLSLSDMRQFERDLPWPVTIRLPDARPFPLRQAG
ncbi:glycosyltransferase involved in cell wall biosynthesis [Novosphingobium sp. SG751A]|uniref:glycosyltransferase family 4 protein n=1 Tax=Novosphingobium sp. SG751A TaxID=2587000 RepID=UPI0020A67DB1|nr:glycosyltransferase family 4 protein [Novosphingobium sp. SG751A]NOW46479.1 glycosyltransferase involved in cell wall biosynthesis [Novosphingobium sp. SG751A]